MSDAADEREPHVPRYHVLAIVSFLLSLSAFSFLPFFGAIGAIVTGKMALGDMSHAPGHYRGELLARLGVWFGWLALVLMAALFVLLLMALVLTGNLVS